MEEATGNRHLHIARKGKEKRLSSLTFSKEFIFMIRCKITGNEKLVSASLRIVGIHSHKVDSPE